MLRGRRPTPRGLVSSWVVTACACLSHSTSHPPPPGPPMQRTFLHTSDPAWSWKAPKCAVAFTSVVSPPLTTHSCRGIELRGTGVPRPRQPRPRTLPRRCEQGRLWRSPRRGMCMTGAGRGDGEGFQVPQTLALHLCDCMLPTAQARRHSGLHPCHLGDASSGRRSVPFPRTLPTSPFPHSRPRTLESFPFCI